jgi:hypothetical protein
MVAAAIAGRREYRTMSDRPAARHAELVRKLYNKTMADALEWAPGSGEEDITLAFSRATIVFGTESEGYYIEVQDEAGSPVDRFTDRNLDAAVTPPVGPNWRAMLQKMWTRANRKLKGADRILEEIMQELDA